MEKSTEYPFKRFASLFWIGFKRRKTFAQADTDSPNERSASMKWFPLFPLRKMVQMEENHKIWLFLQALQSLGAKQTLWKKRLKRFEALFPFFWRNLRKQKIFFLRRLDFILHTTFRNSVSSWRWNSRKFFRNNKRIVTSLLNLSQPTTTLCRNSYFMSPGPKYAK